MKLGWLWGDITQKIGETVAGMLDTVSLSFEQAMGVDFSTFVRYFPFLPTVQSIILTSAMALLILFFLLQLYKNMFGPLGDSEKPSVLFGRLVFSALGVAYSGHALAYILDFAKQPIAELWSAQQVVTHASEKAGFANLMATITKGISVLYGNIGALVPEVLSIIIIVVIGWNYLKLMLEICERYVVLGVLYYLSPLAFSTACTKSTQNIFKAFLRMFSSEVLLIALNVWFIKGFNSAFGSLLSTSGVIDGGGGGSAWTSTIWTGFILNSFCIVAFLKVAQKFDSYLAQLGLSTAQTGGFLAAEIAGAAALAGHAVSKGVQLGKSAGAFFGKNNSSSSSVNVSASKNPNAAMRHQENRAAAQSVFSGARKNASVSSGDANQMAKSLFDPNGQKYTGFKDVEIGNGFVKATGIKQDGSMDAISLQRKQNGQVEKTVAGIDPKTHEVSKGAKSMFNSFGDAMAASPIDASGGSFDSTVAQQMNKGDQIDSAATQKASAAQAHNVLNGTGGEKLDGAPADAAMAFMADPSGTKGQGATWSNAVFENGKFSADLTDAQGNRSHHEGKKNADGSWSLTSTPYDANGTLNTGASKTTTINKSPFETSAQTLAGFGAVFTGGSADTSGGTGVPVSTDASGDSSGGGHGDSAMARGMEQRLEASGHGGLSFANVSSDGNASSADVKDNDGWSAHVEGKKNDDGTWGYTITPYAPDGSGNLLENASTTMTTESDVFAADAKDGDVGSFGDSVERSLGTAEPLPDGAEPQLPPVFDADNADTASVTTGAAVADTDSAAVVTDTDDAVVDGADPAAAAETEAAETSDAAVPDASTVFVAGVAEAEADSANLSDMSPDEAFAASVSSAQNSGMTVDNVSTDPETGERSANVTTADGTEGTLVSTQNEDGSFTNALSFSDANGDPVSYSYTSATPGEGLGDMAAMKNDVEAAQNAGVSDISFSRDEAGNISGSGTLADGSSVAISAEKTGDGQYAVSAMTMDDNGQMISSAQYNAFSPAAGMGQTEAISSMASAAESSDNVASSEITAESDGSLTQTMRMTDGSEVVASTSFNDATGTYDTSYSADGSEMFSVQTGQAGDNAGAFAQDASEMKAAADAGYDVSGLSVSDDGSVSGSVVTPSGESVTVDSVPNADGGFDTTYTGSEGRTLAVDGSSGLENAAVYSGIVGSMNAAEASGIDTTGLTVDSDGAVSGMVSTADGNAVSVDSHSDGKGGFETTYTSDSGATLTASSDTPADNLALYAGSAAEFSSGSSGAYSLQSMEVGSDGAVHAQFSASDGSTAEAVATSTDSGVNTHYSFGDGAGEVDVRSDSAYGDVESARSFATGLNSNGASFDSVEAHSDGSFTAHGNAEGTDVSMTSTPSSGGGFDTHVSASDGHGGEVSYDMHTDAPMANGGQIAATTAAIAGLQTPDKPVSDVSVDPESGNVSFSYGSATSGDQVRVSTNAEDGTVSFQRYNSETGAANSSPITVPMEGASGLSGVAGQAQIAEAVWAANDSGHHIDGLSADGSSHSISMHDAGGHVDVRSEPVSASSGSGSDGSSGASDHRSSADSGSHGSSGGSDRGGESHRSDSGSGDSASGGSASGGPGYNSGYVVHASGTDNNGHSTGEHSYHSDVPLGGAHMQRDFFQAADGAVSEGRKMGEVYYSSDRGMVAPYQNSDGSRVECASKPVAGGLYENTSTHYDSRGNMTGVYSTVSHQPQVMTENPAVLQNQFTTTLAGQTGTSAMSGAKADAAVSAYVGNNNDVSFSGTKVDKDSVSTTAHGRDGFRTEYESRRIGDSNMYHTSAVTYNRSGNRVGHVEYDSNRPLGYAGASQSDRPWRESTHSGAPRMKYYENPKNFAEATPNRDGTQSVTYKNGDTAVVGTSGGKRRVISIGNVSFSIGGKKSGRKKK